METKVTRPPPARPNSALKPLVSTANCAIGVAGGAVEHDAEGSGLAAADAEILIAAVDLGGDGGEIEWAAHVAGDDGGQALDHDVGHGVLNLGIVGL